MSAFSAERVLTRGTSTPTERTRLADFSPFVNPSGAFASTGTPTKVTKTGNVNSVWTYAFEKAKDQTQQRNRHVNLTMSRLFPPSDKFNTYTPLTESAVVTNQILKTDKRGEINKLYDNSGIGTFSNDVERLVETKTLPEQSLAAVTIEDWRMTLITHRIPSLDFNNTSTGGQILSMFSEGLRGYEQLARNQFDNHCAHAKYRQSTNAQEGEDARTATTFKTVTKKKKKKKGNEPASPVPSPAEETKAGSDETGTDEVTLAAPEKLESSENWELTAASKELSYTNVYHMYEEKHTQQERDDWFYERLSRALLISAGCTPEDFEFNNSGRDRWETVGQMVYSAIHTTVVDEERLIDEDERCGEQAMQLETRAEQILKNDIMIMIGGPATIQAAYSNTMKFLLHYLNENETKELKDYFLALTNLTPANGSIIGALLGVIEYCGDFVAAIKTAVTGKGTTNNAIREGVSLIKEEAMGKKDSAFGFATRLHESYNMIAKACTSSNRGIAYLEAAASNGDLHLTELACKRILEYDDDNSGVLSARERMYVENCLDVCDKQKGDETTLTSMLENHHAFCNELKKLHNVRKNSKAKKPRATRRSLAAILSGEPAEPDEDEDDDSSAVSDVTDNTGSSGGSNGNVTLAELVALLKTNGIGGGQNRDKTQAGRPSLREKYQAIWDRDCVTIVDKTKNIICKYCGKPGHGAHECGAYAKDVFLEQPYANACDAYLEHRRRNGKPNIRRPATFVAHHGKTMDISEVNGKKGDNKSNGGNNGNGQGNSGNNAPANQAALNTQDPIEQLKTSLNQLAAMVNQNHQETRNGMRKMEEKNSSTLAMMTSVTDDLNELKESTMDP